MPQYRITEWNERYEVNDKGRPWGDGDKKRAGSLEYVRLKVHGYSQGLGWRRLIAAVGPRRAPVVFGIFVKMLELAADTARDGRGVIEDSAETPLSFVLSLDEQDIRESLEALCQLRWIQKIEEPQGEPREVRESPASTGHVRESPAISGQFRESPETPRQFRESPAISGPLLEPNRTEIKPEKTEPKHNGSGKPASSVGTWCDLASRLRLLVGEDRTIGGRFGRIQAAAGQTLDECFSQERIAAMLDQTESNAAPDRRRAYLQTALDNFIREFNVP